MDLKYISRPIINGMTDSLQPSSLEGSKEKMDDSLGL